MQKTLVISDIHGCYYELQDLLAKVGVGADWQVISIGDMVDRGPFSRDVVGYFKDTPNARAVLGNHENKNIRIFEGEYELQGESQLQTIRSYNFVELNLFIEHIAWFKTLPLYIETENAYICHGYVEPNVPFAEQQKKILIGSMSGFTYLKRRNLMQWDTEYSLQFFKKPVIVGHEVVGDTARSIFDFNGEMTVLKIDTGCVYGGYLTGVVLPDWKIYSVKAHQCYWQSAEQYSENGTAFPVTY